jgi:hypothetical protein
MSSTATFHDVESKQYFARCNAGVYAGKMAVKIEFHRRKHAIACRSYLKPFITLHSRTSNCHLITSFSHPTHFFLRPRSQIKGQVDKRGTMYKIRRAFKWSCIGNTMDGSSASSAVFDRSTEEPGNNATIEEAVQGGFSVGRKNT